MFQNSVDRVYRLIQMLSKKRCQILQDKYKEIVKDEAVAAQLMTTLKSVINYDEEKKLAQDRTSAAKYMVKLREKAKNEGTTVYALRFKKEKL